MTSLLDRFLGGLVGSIMIFSFGVMFLIENPFSEFGETDFKEWQIGLILMFGAPISFWRALKGDLEGIEK